jgi:hypothetical protein
VSRLSRICGSLDLSLPYGSPSGAGIETGLDGRNSIPGTDEIFSSPQHLDRFWGPASLLSNGYWDLSPGAKRPGFEADHSRQCSAEIKNGGAIPPLIIINKHRDTSTFTGFNALD